MCRLCACRRPPPPSPPPRPPRPPMPECSCQSFTDVWWNVQILNQSGERCRHTAVCVLRAHAQLRVPPFTMAGRAADVCGTARRSMQGLAGEEMEEGSACGSASGAGGAATAAQHEQRGVQGMPPSLTPSPCPPCLPNPPLQTPPPPRSSSQTTTLPGQQSSRMSRPTPRRSSAATGAGSRGTAPTGCTRATTPPRCAGREGGQASAGREGWHRLPLQHG